jgi:hypothetical protein
MINTARDLPPSGKYVWCRGWVCLFYLLVSHYDRICLTAPLVHPRGAGVIGMARRITFHPLRVGGAECAHRAPWSRSFRDAGFSGCFRTAWVSSTPSCKYRCGVVVSVCRNHLQVLQ